MQDVVAEPLRNVELLKGKYKSFLGDMNAIFLRS